MGGWRVEWVPDPWGWRELPEDGEPDVQDLPSRVAQMGLLPGDPVFLSPDFRVDEDLLDFVRSPEFSGLERETKRNYATDIRLLLDFLWSRGVRWREASRRDLRDYRVWRCLAPQNPGRVGGSKWNREAAAFTRLYRWAKVSPLPVDVGRAGDRAPDGGRDRVCWLTPRTWRLWMDIGLRGQTRSRVAAAEWSARTETRNTAFVGLLLSSGLRRQEAGSLLTFEVPQQRLRQGMYCHGQVPGALTRAKRDRTFYASVAALGDVETYVQSERAWAVRRAQQAGRYDALPQMRVITQVTGGLRSRVRWVDRNGVEGGQALSALTWQERQWLFTEGPEGPEPAWLWLSERGLPLAPHSWEGVFRGANVRCERLLRPREADRQEPALAYAPYATPHAARHSFALYMLVVLNELMEKRYGLTPRERRDFALLFGDPWFLVQTLLGHADVELTKRIYLAPVTHLRLSSILAAADEQPPGPTADLDAVFARIARETSGIVDMDARLETAR
ncbi:integrase [Streptacidiphilus monticola]|uniref:Integrase n=1 Tax=Streptacidiphilus monticola TaxID=2161674 RepID=A0ABW1G445_9ACTN